MVTELQRKVILILNDTLRLPQDVQRCIKCNVQRLFNRRTKIINNSLSQLRVINFVPRNFLSLSPCKNLQDWQKGTLKIISDSLPRSRTVDFVATGFLPLSLLEKLRDRTTNNFQSNQKQSRVVNFVAASYLPSPLFEKLRTRETFEGNNKHTYHNHEPSTSLYRARSPSKKNRKNERCST